MLHKAVIVILLHLAILSSAQQALTREQKIALVEFKELVKNDLKQEYRAEDEYLVKWLRKENFNVTASVQLLQEYLEWRAEEKMDTILEEDWSDMRARFPYSFDTVDKSGRPILYYDWGNWELSAFLEGGQPAYDRLTRYSHMYKEDIATHIRQLRSQGSNVTKYISIINARNLKPENHYCSYWLELSMDIAGFYAKYLPAVESEQTTIINVPSSFKMIFSKLPAKTQTKLLIYGQDRTQWEQKLLESIDLDQLPTGIFKEPEQKDNSEGLLNFKWKEEP